MQIIKENFDEMPFEYEIGKKKWSFQSENGPKRCVKNACNINYNVLYNK